MSRPFTTDHISTARIDVAAAWLAVTPREAIAGSVVCELRSRFGLDLPEAVHAIQEAQRLRADGGGNGG